jgi:hypothetical protein
MKRAATTAQMDTRRSSRKALIFCVVEQESGTATRPNAGPVDAQRSAGVRRIPTQARAMTTSVSAAKERTEQPIVFVSPQGARSAAAVRDSRSERAIL